MLKILVAIISIPSAILLSTLILGATGVSYDNIRDQAKLVVEQANTQRFKITDGTEMTIPCIRPTQVGIGLRCSAFQGSVYLVRLHLFEEEVPENREWKLWAKFQLLPPQTDSFTTQMNRLSEFEQDEDPILIAKVIEGPWGLYVRGSYNIDREALKAIVASYLNKAADIEKLELSNIDVERTAEVFAVTASPYIGAFKVRAEAYLMIFEGDMEYLIVVCFFISLLLLIASLFLEKGQKESNDRGSLWNASDSIAATLTYLGLLGTLIGMFGTVTELSRIDYVDPMMKVFDQTTSFGSMSLAIGTSVVGLTGSIVIWLAQTAVDLLQSEVKKKS